MGRLYSPLIVGLLAGAAFGSPTVIHAKSTEPIELYPSSNWKLDFGEDKCSLARAFGESDDRHVMVFEQGGPDDDFVFTLAGPRLSKFRRGQQIAIQFGDFAESKVKQPFLGDNGTFGTALIYSSLDFENLEAEDGDGDGDELRSSLPSIDTAKAGKVEFVSVQKGKRHLRLNTGSLGPAMEAMNSCTQDLVKAWGLDLDRHLKLTRLPVWGNQASIVKSIQRSYPSSALRAGEQAIIRMRVNIDTEGNVTECVLTDATVTNRLGSPACQEMQQAKFQPGLDEEGVAMPSFYLTNIVYKMASRGGGRTGSRTR